MGPRTQSAFGSLICRSTDAPPTAPWPYSTTTSAFAASRWVATAQAASVGPVVTPVHGAPSASAATLGSGHRSPIFSSALVSALLILRDVFDSAAQAVFAGSLPDETLSLHFWRATSRPSAYLMLSLAVVFWHSTCGAATAPPEP